MKIAVASVEGQVAEHFGRCPEYTIIVTEKGEIKDKTVISNPGHEPGFLPRFLADMGVNCIVAGGMGPRAQQLFDEKGIEVVTGVRGAVTDIVTQYLAGILDRGQDLCHHER